MRRLICVLLLSSILTSAYAVEIVQWQRLPIAVPLHVGQERILFIDQNVRVGMPRSLKSQLRVQSNGGALYLRASEPIEPTRLQLQNVTTGEIILIDIAARPALKDAPKLEPIKIMKTDSGTASTEATVAEAKPSAATPVPVVLTRYAAQSLYAPLRTVEPLPGVTQVRVNSRTDLASLLPTLPIKASVLGAWQLDDFWVTAVQLQNLSDTPLTLDPRLLQGDFVAASFQHQMLGQYGIPSDTTALYLITRGHGLAESLLPALSRVDATLNLPDRRSAADEK